MYSERVTFKTPDGVTVVGTHATNSVGGPAALLLHMMPATKESWEPFTEALLQRGFSDVLAIDLRGHGESTEGPDGAVLDFRLFEDADHQSTARDVAAAVAWLVNERGTDVRRLCVAGASIGANLAIAYGATDARVPAVAALSPGLDYRGVTTGDKVTAYEERQRLYLAASKEDPLSFKTVRALAKLRPHGTTVKEFEDAGHGTAMFERAPGFLEELADWLRDAAH